jgi:glyoxylase-like metal-dependent hydrolase (beta-lactamase superfamily II)
LHPSAQPTAVRHVVQVTPHVFMFGPEMAGKNFAIIIADSGRGLLVDCGLFPELQLHQMLGEMQQHLGLKGIDACWISHMHGDHFTLAPVLRRLGVKLWTMDAIADKCENPRHYDYPAMIEAYGAGVDSVPIDRRLRDGEVVDWEGLRLHFDWMPGQTEFGNCLWLEVDGKKLAFTGDNIFGDPADEKQDGHECVVARNSALLEEGYLAAAQYLEKLKPNVIVGAHSILMTEPAAFVTRYRAWAERMIRRYREILPGEGDAYAQYYDPYWVAAYPYRVDLADGKLQEVSLTLRNFTDRSQQFRVVPLAPPGVTLEPAEIVGEIPAKSRKSFPLRVSAAVSQKVAPGPNMVLLDTSVDGKAFGPLFDFLVQARE